MIWRLVGLWVAVCKARFKDVGFAHATLAETMPAVPATNELDEMVQLQGELHPTACCFLASMRAHVEVNLKRSRPDRGPSRISALAGIVEDFGVAVVELFAGFDDSGAHIAVAAGEVFADGEDFVDRAGGAEAWPRADQGGGEREGDERGAGLGHGGSVACAR